MSQVFNTRQFPVLLDFIFKLIADAERLMSSHNHQRIPFSEKEKGSWVTETDTAIEKSWVKSIYQNFPNSVIIGEETGQHDTLTTHSQEPQLTWYLDPIDGTSNFVQRIPFYCNAIGVFCNQQAIASMIHIPNLKESYWALAGQGAYCNNRLIAASTCHDWEDAVVVHGAHLLQPQFSLYPWQSNLKKVHARRLLGSAAIELAYVACGKLDASFHQNLQPWDVACALCLLKESGAQAFNFDLNAAKPEDKNFVTINGSLPLAHNAPA